MNRKINHEYRVKLGIIGLGGGAGDMIPVFASHGGYEIVAASDIEPDQLERFSAEFESSTYVEAERLCTDSNVELVYIATPNQFHYEHIMMALNHGKHVFVEKPMTLNLEEAEVIIGLANRNNLRLGVNVKHSFEPRIQLIRRMVVNGELGNLLMLNYWQYTDWLYRARTPEELDADLGGGVTWRQGPHQFDIIRTIGGGLVRSVRAMSGIWDETRPVPSCHLAFLEFENGVAATAVYDGFDHFKSEIFNIEDRDNSPDDISLNHASARRRLANMTDSTEEIRLKASQRYGGVRTRGNSSASWVLGGPLIVSFEKGDVRLTPQGIRVYGDEECWEISTPADLDGRHGIVNEFYESIKEERPPIADGRWGKATLEILLAVRDSSDQRKELIMQHQVSIQSP